MSDSQKQPTPLTYGMAMRIQAARQKAAERDRRISRQAARGIRKIEQYLQEMDQ